MSSALTPPFLVACLVLCVAGIAKLRAPAVAAAALRTHPSAIRALAVGEVSLGAAGVVHPGPAVALAVALLYGLFAGVAVRLRRDRVACGCFGDNGLPVSLAHVIASELLAALAVAAAFTEPRGVDWLASQPAGRGVALAVGMAGAAYGVVLVYTALPRAWGAWNAADPGARAGWSAE